MTGFKMNGVLANPSNIAGAIYANQNSENATDAQDNELLYYSNGAPTSSSTLSFNPSTNQLDLIGTIAAVTGNIGTLSATTQLNLPLTQIQSYNPLPIASSFFGATGRNQGYTLNLGGIKLSWGVTRFDRTALGTATAFTVQSLGSVFGATPTLIANIESIGVATDQYITMNAVANNSFNFWINNNTAIGEAFGISWIAFGN
jgi:hypothetical protein